jgi:ABC-type nickel/cobalt efflux system permease component RcnA
MRRVLAAFLIFVVSSAGVFSQETRARSSRRGEASGFASRDASTLSIMGWGIGLAVGIATLFALLENNSTHGDGGGGGGNGGHTH